MDHFENLDLRTISTPIKIDRLKAMLEVTGYDQRKTKFLIDGFTNGFDFHYEGSSKRSDLSNNLPLTCGSKTQLWNKVMKEVKLG